jgi:hypothetical protein
MEIRREYRWLRGPETTESFQSALRFKSKPEAAATLNHRSLAAMAQNR